MSEIERKENEQFQEEEISLREIIEVILRHKWFIIGLMLLTVMAAGIFTFLQREGYVASVVKMDFEEIEEGIYPSEEPFTKSDIISPYILSQVVEDLNLLEKDLGVRDIQEMIEVEELFYEVGNEDEPELEPAYQYRLILHPHEEKDVSPQLKRQILSSVVENYRQEYAQEFIEKPLFPNLTEGVGETGDMDYPFLSRNLRSYQSIFKDHAITMAEETESFYSTRFGISFRDLARQLDNIKEHQYEDISALIRTNSLTKDREGAIRQFESLMEELNFKLDKKDKEAEYVKGLLKDAEPLRTGTLPDTFPALIAEGDFELMEEIFDKFYRENFYPELLQVSVEAAEEAIDINQEISFLRQDLQILQENPRAEDDLTPLKEKVDKDINELIGSLNRAVNIHNNMMEEYYEEKAQRGISYAVMPYYDVTTGNLQLNLAVAAVLGLMLGVFIAFFREFWNNTSSE